jgi:CheY-like chemotaxis protein
MNGSIKVQSKVGQGSTFTVLLPLAQATVMDALPHEASEPHLAPRRRGRLLVIDDEEVVAMAIHRSLTRDHDVVYTSTAQEALALLRANEQFDVILCDLMMPEMTGMELYAELMATAPEQARRIIFVTGGAFTAQAREFLQHVPSVRIEKPFNVQQLRALVNERIR